MEQPLESGLPASLVNGRLEGVSVPDLLWNLCRRRSTGALHLTAQGITKKVYIDAGRIVFARSDDADDRLGDLLLREELITLDQFESAVAQLSSGRRLGTILVSAGHLSPENLVRGVVRQVKAIVLGLFPLEEGEYAFVEGPLPSDEVITLGMRTGEILVQGIRQVRSFSRIRKSVGPPAARFRLDAGWRETLDGLDIRDGERMLLQRLDEAGARGASIESMCGEVFLSNFEIYQALWAFLVLGIIQEVDGAAEGATATARGRFERSSLPEILVSICHDQVTGVLHMTRGTLERTLHITGGRCIFATSNAVDDGLVAHLLRRGVISLRDREETARRLLSNKRVGTILLELGVIDEDDLRSTVRDQLSEIIFDTFRWEHGDFQFVEGELPTIEDITLTRTLEELVFAGVRRVTSWSRVREGCGGLGARLTLLPEYLSVLDKMTVGPEEWELISLLKKPKTVLEICRESVLGDFRSCQILWALRLLGGIGEAPLEVSVDTALDRIDSQPAAEPQFADAFETPQLASAPDSAPEPDPTPIPMSEADTTAEVVSEPWRLAAGPGFADTYETDETASAFESAPEQEPTPLAMSEADTTAEVVSEAWRLASGPGFADTIATHEAASTPESASEPEPASGADASADVDSEPAAVGFQFDSPADATLSVSREEVEAALRGPGSDPPHFELGDPGTGLEPMMVDLRPTAPPTEDKIPVFEPPEELESAMTRFNARHVVLFRALRAEIGAGAANFVRSCRTGLDGGFAQMFASADLRADGSWDPEALKRSVIEHRVSNADEGFRQLIDAEIEKLRVHLGETKTGSLADQLASIP